jgi:hypothetical protein
LEPWRLGLVSLRSVENVLLSTMPTLNHLE